MNFTHSELCDIGERYLRKTIGCLVTAKEIVSLIGEIPDAIGFLQGYSFLIEAKVSRSDFLADQKKVFRKDPAIGIGDFRYYICEKGLIKPEELPDKWGLIYVNEKGKARQVVGGRGNIYCKNDWKHEKDVDAERMLLMSLARRITFLGVVKDGDWTYPAIAERTGCGIDKIKGR